MPFSSKAEQITALSKIQNHALSKNNSAAPLSKIALWWFGFLVHPIIYAGAGGKCGTAKWIVHSGNGWSWWIRLQGNNDVYLGMCVCASVRKLCISRQLFAGSAVKGGKVTICKHKQGSSLSNEQTGAIVVPNNGSMLPQQHTSTLTHTHT